MVLSNQVEDRYLVMTVQELIDELREQDSELEVMFAYNSGDYWRNEVAESPDRVSQESVEYSDYHLKYKTLTEEEEFDYESKHGAPPIPVVILR
jgi:hypothetical protein